MEKVMIVGLGYLGRYLLGYLAKTPNIPEIVVCSRDRENGQKRVNIERVGAALSGLYPNIRFVEADVESPSFVEVLQKEKPSIIVNSTRKIKGLKYGRMSISLGIGYGAWMVFALPLSYKVAKSVHDSGIQTRLINTSYSDGVCPVLKTIPECTTPWIGIGNLNHLIPRIQIAVSDLLPCAMKEVEVYFVAGHYSNTYISRQGDPAGAPTYLKVLVNGENVTERVGGQNLIYKHSALPIAEGAERNIMASSSTYMTIMQILQNRGELIHAPGPMGLIGGYPVRISSEKVSLALPGDLSLQEAIAINEANIRYDGIEKIDHNGNVIFTEHNYQTLKSAINYDCPRLNADYNEWCERGLELISKLKEKGFANAI